MDESVPLETVNNSEVSWLQAFGYEEAVERCTFEKNREILRRAIELEGKRKP